MLIFGFMRSHQTIVTEIGASKLYQALAALGRELAPNTPQRWAERDRIPNDWWPDLIAMGATTIEELQATRRPRKRRAPAHQQAAA